MSHLLAFVAGMILTYIITHGRADIKSENNLTCPQVNIDPEPDKEVLEAFKECSKERKDFIEKLFKCQQNKAECEIKVHDLENDRCQTRPQEYNY